jgi:hypothetical protein
MRTIVARPVHPEESGAAQIPNEGIFMWNPLFLRAGAKYEGGGDTTKRMPSANEADCAGDQEAKDRSSTLVT